MRSNLCPPQKNQHQKGMATFTTAMLLMLLLLIVGMFAVRMNVFEQRTAVNENRAQMVASVSEAALNQGVEFLKASSAALVSTQAGTNGAADGWFLAGSVRWQPCSTALAAGSLDPCLAEPDATRRAGMYRYYFNNSTALPLAQYSGASQIFTTVGGFADTYQVAAALCRLDTTNPAAPVCSLATPANSPMAITVLSEAKLTGEGATARTRETMATFKLIGTAVDVPLVAANSVSGLGSAEIVPNPNAAGIGIPLSIWSNKKVAIDAGGAMRTCHLGEWLASNTVTPYDGINYCSKCTCKGLSPTSGLISGKDPSNPSYQGADILDVGGGGALPDNTYFPVTPLDDPANDFDNSVFDYVFGVNTTTQGATAPRTNCVSTDNPGGNCENQTLFDLGASISADCSGLNSASKGLLWVTGDCSLGTQIGTPSNPVLLVVDGCITANANLQFYGLLFQRATACADLNNRGFAAAGGGQIYGAVVAMAAVNIRGSIQFIYNQTVLDNLVNSPAFRRFGLVPGSWSDEACYNANKDCRS